LTCADVIFGTHNIYGAYGYIAPILHVRKVSGADLFETYMKSFELIWNEESYDLSTSASSAADRAN
jgi:hypothetical protein